MGNLLAANLTRLLKNRGFWLTVLLLVGIDGAFYGLLLRKGPMPMDIILFFYLQYIGLLFSIFFSLFLGTEYGDGTIRNKLIIGHKRSNIYLASLITGIAAITILYFAGMIAGSILGVLLCAPPHNPLGQNIMAGLTGWIACIAFASIFNLIGMVSANKAMTAIICLLTSFFLLFSAIYTFNQLSKPDYLVGNERMVYQALQEINPSGQIMLIMSMSIFEPWKLIAYALSLSVLFTGIGLYAFNKKEIK